MLSCRHIVYHTSSNYIHVYCHEIIIHTCSVFLCTTVEILSAKIGEMDCIRDAHQQAKARDTKGSIGRYQQPILVLCPVQ